MQYRWSGDHAFSVAALPKAAASHLKLAGAASLRVLVWLCCIGEGEFDAARCAADCGGSPADCEDALQYWVNEGLVTLEGDAPPATPKPSAPVSLAAALQVEPMPVAAPLAAQADKPTMSQTAQAKTQDSRLAYLLETAEKTLGKPLSGADMTTYYYLYKTVGLPPEVILMAIGYAVKNGKAKLSYIEKTALNWAERGITTMAAADEHLCRLERCEQAWQRVATVCKADTPHPTVSQKETAYRWVYERGFSDELLALVADHTLKKIDKFQMSYMDRILEGLYADGVTDTQAAEQALSAPKKKERRAPLKTDKGRAPSFDLSEYEKMALRHRPQIPQEG